MLESEFVGFDI